MYVNYSFINLRKREKKRKTLTFTVFEDTNHRDKYKSQRKTCSFLMKIWLRTIAANVRLTHSFTCALLSFSVMSNSWDPMDGSLPGSSVHGILQARILELPFPSLGDLPDLGIILRSPSLQADSLLSEPPGNLFIHSLSIYLFRTYYLLGAVLGTRNISLNNEGKVPTFSEIKL